MSWNTLKNMIGPEKHVHTVTSFSIYEYIRPGVIDPSSITNRKSLVLSLFRKDVADPNWTVIYLLAQLRYLNEFLVSDVWSDFTVYHLVDYPTIMKPFFIDVNAPIADAFGVQAADLINATIELWYRLLMNPRYIFASSIPHPNIVNNYGRVMSRYVPMTMPSFDLVIIRDAKNANYNVSVSSTPSLSDEAINVIDRINPLQLITLPIKALDRFWYDIWTSQTANRFFSYDSEFYQPTHNGQLKSLLGATMSARKMEPQQPSILLPYEWILFEGTNEVGGFLNNENYYSYGVDEQLWTAYYQNNPTQWMLVGMTWLMYFFFSPMATKSPNLSEGHHFSKEGNKLCRPASNILFTDVFFSSHRCVIFDAWNWFTTQTHGFIAISGATLRQIIHAMTHYRWQANIGNAHRSGKMLPDAMNLWDVVFDNTAILDLTLYEYLISYGFAGTPNDLDRLCEREMFRASKYKYLRGDGIYETCMDNLTCHNLHE